MFSATLQETSVKTVTHVYRSKADHDAEGFANEVVGGALVALAALIGFFSFGVPGAIGGFLIGCLAFGGMFA